MEGKYDVFAEEGCPYIRYELGRCPQCADPFLVEYEDIGAQNREWSLTQLYPRQRTAANKAFPESVQHAFGDALSSLKYGIYTGAAMCCRKTIEAMCSDHGKSRGSLAKSLLEMRESDVIDRRLFDWADALRLAGNGAAHDVDETVSKQDAIDIVDFTHAILEYTYTYRDKFVRFMQYDG